MAEQVEKRKYSWDAPGTGKNFKLRCPERNVQSWLAAHARSGLTFNKWVVTSINRQVELEEAILRMQAEETAKGTLVDRTPGETP